MRSHFAAGSSKAEKRATGRPSLERVPVVVRSADEIGAGLERRVRAQLASRVGRAAGLIERITVRFDDINGPRGGRDTLCRIKVVMAGRPSIVVEKRATSHAPAFAEAVTAVATAVERAQGKHRLPGTRRERRHVASRAPRPTARVPEDDAGELIGRRVGHGRKALARALDRPEKRDRAAYVDTAAPGVSASHRRAGGYATARRNTLGRAPRATAMLEDSRTRPSRKSTRRSANRGKPSQTKERATMTRLGTPASRHTRRG
jgi:hypothetical protein